MQLREVTSTPSINPSIIRALVGLEDARMKDLAAATGISESRMSRIINGRFQWTDEEARKVADALNVPREVFYLSTEEALLRLAGPSNDPPPRGRRRSYRGREDTIGYLQVIPGLASAA